MVNGIDTHTDGDAVYGIVDCDVHANNGCGTTPFVREHHERCGGVGYVCGVGEDDAAVDGCAGGGVMAVQARTQSCVVDTQ